jgi:predicted kinase
MKPTLYIMCGLPYSGKSTIAQRLAEESNLPIVSVDEIRESMGFYWNEHEASGDDWKRIFQAVDRGITDHLNAGQSVIYDSANQDKASRQKYATLAQSLGSEARIVFVDTPLEIIEQRRAANVVSGERHHIPDRFYQAALDSFEPPTSDEHVLNASEVKDLL